MDERGFETVLDEIDFNALANANMKFSMDILMFKIRYFLICSDEFYENLTFAEREAFANIIKVVITEAIGCLSK